MALTEVLVLPLKNPVLLGKSPNTSYFHYVTCETHTHRESILIAPDYLQKGDFKD